MRGWNPNLKIGTSLALLNYQALTQNTSSAVSGTEVLDLEVKPFDVNAAAAKLITSLDSIDGNTQFATIDSLPKDIFIVGKSNAGYSRLNGSVSATFDYEPENVSWADLESNGPNARRNLSAKEKTKRKLKNKAVKAARKQNR